MLSSQRNYLANILDQIFNILFLLKVLQPSSLSNYYLNWSSRCPTHFKCRFVYLPLTSINISTKNSISGMTLHYVLLLFPVSSSLSRRDVRTVFFLVTPALKVNKSLFAKCVHDTHCLSKEISGTKKESSYIFKSEARPSQSNLAQSIIDWETRTVMWSHLKKDTTIQLLLQSPLANRNQKSVERGSLMWWYSTLRFYRTPKIIFNDNIPPAVYVTAERIGFAQGKRRLVALMSLND